MKQYFIKYNDFLNESRNSAWKKYVDTGLIEPSPHFHNLEYDDPTPTKKYLEKMCEWFLNDKVSREEIKQYILKFHSLVPKLKEKDINKYESFEDFKKLMDETESNTSKKKAITKGIKVILENDDVQITQPQTYEQSCILGAGTTWCTASKDTSDHWDRYNDQLLTFYYIWFKKIQSKKYYKIAVGVNIIGEFKEIFDAQDNRMTDEQLEKKLKKYKIDKSIFVPEYKGKSKLEMVNGLLEKGTTYAVEQAIEIIGNNTELQTPEMFDTFVGKGYNGYYLVCLIELCKNYQTQEIFDRFVNEINITTNQYVNVLRYAPTLQTEYNFDRFLSYHVTEDDVNDLIKNCKGYHQEKYFEKYVNRFPSLRPSMVWSLYTNIPELRTEKCKSLIDQVTKKYKNS